MSLKAIRRQTHASINHQQIDIIVLRLLAHILDERDIVSPVCSIVFLLQVPFKPPRSQSADSGSRPNIQEQHTHGCRWCAGSSAVPKQEASEEVRWHSVHPAACGGRSWSEQHRALDARSFRKPRQRHRIAQEGQQQRTRACRRRGGNAVYQGPTVSQANDRARKAFELMSICLLAIAGCSKSL